MIAPNQIKKVMHGRKTSAGRQMARICQAISAETLVSLKQMKGPSRQRHVARARQLAMWQGRQQGLSLHQIADYLNRDHTTVVHGARLIQQIMDAAE